MFWNEVVPALKLPSQPAFDEYLRLKRDINPAYFAEINKGGTFMVNLLRFTCPEQDLDSMPKEEKMGMLRMVKGFNEIAPLYTEQQTA